MADTMPMLSALSFGYPGWMLLLCALLAFIYTFSLYYKSEAFADTGKWLLSLLGVLRFCSAFLIACLLLIPILTYISNRVETPLLLIAEDDSESIVSVDNFDSLAYVQGLESTKSTLGEEFELENWTFGDTIDFQAGRSFAKKETNIAEVISKAKDLYRGRAVAGIILPTDGLYNLGSDPTYTAEHLGFPLIPIALGDTNSIADLRIDRLLANSTVQLDDQFAMDVDVSAKGIESESAVLRISEINNGKATLISQKTLRLDGKNYFHTHTENVKAARAGVMHLRVSISSSLTEKNTVNNVRDLYINVLDTRKNILILAANSHPDLGAFKRSLSKDQRNKITVLKSGDGRIDFSQFQMIILHNLPAVGGAGITAIREIEELGIPCLYVVGRKTDTESLNAIQDVMDIDGNKQSNEVTGIFQKGFNLFRLNPEGMDTYEVYPPLQSPFGNYSISAGTQVLFKQYIGAIESQYPLIAVSDANGKRAGVIAAEGLWRWRLHEYLESKSQERFDEIIHSLVNFLSTSEEKERFVLNSDKDIYNQNEQVHFHAEVLNKSYQRVSQGDVHFTLVDQDGISHDYRFGKNEDGSYNLNLGLLENGDYSYSAVTNLDGERMSKSGKFTVVELRKEKSQTVARHDLLYALAEKTGGKVFYLDQIQEIPRWLSQQSSSKKVQYSGTSQSPLHHSRLYLGIVILLLALEWFLRRFYGSY